MSWPAFGTRSDPVDRMRGCRDSSKGVQEIAKETITRITVHLGSQTVEAHIGKKLFHKCDCVTGDRNHDTRKGKYVVERKHSKYTSKTYGVPMNYAMFYYKGLALHQYHGLPWGLPWAALRVARSYSDSFGSHGSVRLQEADARKLFDNSVEKKTEVWVVA